MEKSALEIEVAVVRAAFELNNSEHAGEVAFQMKHTAWEMHKAEFGLVEGSSGMKLVEQTALEPGEREKVIGGVGKDAFWLEKIPCQLKQLG